MAFPTTGILDNFNRADGDIGANWNHGGTVNITSNEVLLDDTYTTSTNSVWNSTSYGVDQEAHITITDVTFIGASATSVSLILKKSDSVHSNQTMLLFVYRHTTNLVEIFKVENGTFTSLTTRAVTFADGDEYGVQVIGNNAYLYKNGTQFGDPVDVSSFSGIGNSGYIGFRFFLDATDKISIDDFGGGTYVSTSIPVIYHHLQEQRQG